MSKKISVYESNKNYKNPLFAVGICTLIILMLVDWFWGTKFASIPNYHWSILVIILSFICTKNSTLFKILQCTFFFPLLFTVFSFRFYIYPVHIRDYTDVLFRVYKIVRPIYLLIITGIYATALFKPYKYKGEGYLNMPLHIIALLLLPVFWNTYWVFKTTRVLNKISTEPKRNAFLQTLLYLIVPFYALYWTYTTARRSDVVAVAKGLPSNTAALCLILKIFLPFLPPMIIQDKINQIVSDDGAVFKVLQNMSAKKEKSPNSSVPDELKKYKELLDCEAITQEEYNKKKAELLN